MRYIHPNQTITIWRDMGGVNVEHLQHLCLERRKWENNTYVTNDEEIKVEIGIEKVVCNNHVGHLHCRTCLQGDFFLVTWRWEVNLLPKGNYFSLNSVMRLNLADVLWLVSEVAIIFLFPEKMEGKKSLSLPMVLSLSELMDLSQLLNMPSSTNL